MLSRFVILTLSVVMLSMTCQAEEKVQIPKVVDKKLVGEWKVVKIGDGEVMAPLPDGRSLGLILKEDGNGFQIKGKRKIAINWGAGEKGEFAAQWDQSGGNGDAIAGKWALTEEGLELDLMEYEDGKGPGEEKIVLLLKRVEG